MCFMMTCIIVIYNFCFVQVHAILPLLPLSSPVIWYLLNNYGLAKILAVYEEGKSDEYEVCYHCL